MCMHTMPSPHVPHGVHGVHGVVCTPPHVHDVDDVHDVHHHDVPLVVHLMVHTTHGGIYHYMVSPS